MADATHIEGEPSCIGGDVNKMKKNDCVNDEEGDSSIAGF